MTFEASQLAVHYGDTFDLTCTVRGFPANLTSIQTRYGVELTNQIRGRLDAYTTRAFVPIMDSEEGEFVCVSESYLLGSLVARLEKHISISIYSKLVAIVQLHVPHCFSLPLPLPPSFPLSSSPSDYLHDRVCYSQSE